MRKRPTKKSEVSIPQNESTEVMAEVEVEIETKLPDTPEDFELFNLIEKCQKEVAGLPTTKLQVVALARLGHFKLGNYCSSNSDC